MADFKFIVIPELRQCLESDYKELRACLKAEAWKAVHVLAGSIVEAVLIDALSGASLDQVKLDSMELSQLIACAKQKDILEDEAVDLSTVIRKYRNLIHPGRIKRLEKAVDASGAVVAAELVEIITKQVAKRKQETYGYTAEQLLERLRGGSSALPLVAHLVNDTPKHEIERLLVDVLPAAYMEALADGDSTPDQDRHLISCYRTVFDAAERDVKATVTKNLYRVYRSAQEATVIIYEESFFKAAHLSYLSESERRFIKAHFLPRVTLDTLGDLLYNLGGVGPFLDSEETASLCVTLMLAMQGEDKGLARRAQLLLFFEYRRMTAESRSAARAAAAAINDAEILAKLEQREASITSTGEAARA